MRSSQQTPVASSECRGGVGRVPSRPAPGFAARFSSRPEEVDDVHSQLNRTRVARVLRPRTVSELQAVVRAAREVRVPVSICGGRHAMGGQQFCSSGWLVDLSDLSRVIDFDADRGHVTVEAGIQWPALVTHLVWAGAGRPGTWGIVQKQTGADTMSLGGSLAANIHGRGLRLKPIIADVERFELVDAAGNLVRCSRSENAELFALAIGGYGLFGPIATITLRLTPRHKIERRVAIACVDDLPDRFERRLQEGCEFGDFQFATDPRSREFLQAGVLSCYRPVGDGATIPDGQHHLSERDWRRLILLAHTSKSAAFAEYARYYLSTHGQIYWSDTHQLSEYWHGYHADLDSRLGSAVRGSEMITELYVPRPRLPGFMSAVRADAIKYAYDIVYGTVRLIERDDESVLSWAREPWACIVFNLHVAHTPDGIATAASHFRRLIDRAIEQGGSYYLTYHRWATAEQARTCHPRLAEFFSRKDQYDPDGVFRSDWYSEVRSDPRATAAIARSPHVSGS